MLHLARLLRPSYTRYNTRLQPRFNRYPRRMVTTAPHPVHSPATPEPAPGAAQGEATIGKKAKKDKVAKDGAQLSLELNPVPDFINHRIKIFETAKAEYDLFVKNQPRQEIHVTMPDGSKRTGTSWETSPMDIAREVSKSLSERVVIAKVDSQLWDLERPLEGSCSLELLDFENAEGKRVFWHSSAHVLGEAAERHFGCHLCIGPPIEDGFFYEMAMGVTERNVLETDLPALETISKSAIKERQRFERLVLPKETLLEMFRYNKYKVHIIETKIPDGTSTTVYRCGPMVDLCVGPHVPHTGRIKAFSVLKNSSSYFLGDQANDSLQRVYGISFPDAKQLTEYKAFLAEAARRDHRKIGKDQELFFFHELSPGSAFFLPHGTRIYNALLEMLRSEYRKRDYQEVISPNMYNSKLFQTSGHWQNYRENIFSLDVERETFGMKPMNCPGHCLVFGARDRSYKELPLRMAEFGVLHRNEASGALAGLTRVRRFVQDDTHVFCTPQQIEGEIEALFDFLQHVYGIFGFDFELELSTRPDKFLGEIAAWDTAEKQLTAALEKFHPGRWTLNPADGAFYGPKIDIKIRDALRRSFQCATIQLDFQLPVQFDLRYRGAADAAERPVMIHRAILGSLERFMAIMTEHFAGKWPFWISPRQALVIPVAAPYKDYAAEVGARLSASGLWADVDNGDNTLQKKIRNGEIAQYNFILVVGQDELDARSVNVRNRDDVGMKARADVMVPLDDIERQLVALKESRSLLNKLT